MSHAELLELIDAQLPYTALRILIEDPRLCTDSDEPSALMLALYRGQPGLAGAIASRRRHLTIFEIAAAGLTEALQRALAEPGSAQAIAADGFTALHLACFFGHQHAAALLLQAGADPRAVARNASRVQPLHSAATNGHAIICHMLLHAGADPDAAQHGGYTSLHAAALRGDIQLTNLLLAYRAQRHMRSDDGRTAGDIARQLGLFDIARTLG